MGLIAKILAPRSVASLGQAVAGVAEVFTPSATRRMELSAEAQMTALQQFGSEFQTEGIGWFDSMINGLNRLPRPFLAFGTIGLFIYAMIDPAGFAPRMAGLAAVPDPLWWLLGAVVAFYFGARETHYFRNMQAAGSMIGVAQGSGDPALPGSESMVGTGDNPALEDWRNRPA